MNGNNLSVSQMEMLKLMPCPLEEPPSLTYS